MHSNYPSIQYTSNPHQKATVLLLLAPPFFCGTLTQEIAGSNHILVPEGDFTMKYMKDLKFFCLHYLHVLHGEYYSNNFALLGYGF